MAESATASYLSGILIGHEVRAALGAQRDTVVEVIGTLELTALYARAIAACGCYAERRDGDAAAHGLAAIGEHAAWS
jgi:2-dehydro-3-deoxygalactonokinase